MQQPSIELKNAGRKALSACACTVAEKYRNGLQLHRQPTGLPLAWRGLLKELRSCCPGFTDIEYGIALNRAFTGSCETTPFPDPNYQDSFHQ
jgi:hypothetical protein